MNIDLLLPAIPGLQFTDISNGEKSLTLFLNTTHPCALCPLCKSKSERVHSFYHRKVADLPWADKQLYFQLQVRRFFCEAEGCGRKVFCERLHPSVAAYARRTSRMEKHLQTLGLHLGGEGAVLLSRLLNISSISAGTFLNLIRKVPQDDYPTPKFLGIDEWVIRKGKTYATILVDLERRQVIDLLKDARLETIHSWLTEHPGVEVISRDRDSTFAEGARKGAPQAIQVADRWYLLKNLGDAVKRMLEINQAGLRATAKALLGESTGDSLAESLTESEVKVVITDKIRSLKEGISTKTEMKHEQARKLAAQDCSIKGIARQLKMHRQTVKKYMQMENPPRKFYSQHMDSKRSLSNEQRVYLAKRWKEADVNARQLWQELKEQGYEGSAASIYRAVAHFPAHHKESVGTKKVAKEAIPALSSRLAMWLLVKPKEKLSDKDQDVLLKLLDNHPQSATVYPLVQDFISMAKERKSDHLDDWISRARESGVTQLAQFASGLKRDYGAVKAGLSMEWSNGQVEGQITRLKLIKRLGYGRANLDLLKKRVLYKPFAQVA